MTESKGQVWSFAVIESPLIGLDCDVEAVDRVNVVVCDWKYLFWKKLKLPRVVQR